MDNTSTIEKLKQILDSEESSESLTTLPQDIYIRLSNYSQKLRATTSSSSDDAPGRLARKQLWLIEAMTRRLLQLRLTKSRKGEERVDEMGQPSSASNNLLPEERHIEDMIDQLAKKKERFIKAVVNGQSSFFFTLQKRETQKMETVRIIKRAREVMGADLKRYGPFEVNDIARLPSGNAQVMTANKEAVAISSKVY